MKNIAIVVVLIFLIACKGPANTVTSGMTPHATTFIGNFTDDYGIRYSISDTAWLQHPRVKYHILSWNKKEQYLVARNDKDNPSEAGLYTRIDYMTFENMQPFEWGFCLTVYNAGTKKEAIQAAKADRQNPKKGCGGYPFSRMKRTE